MANKVVELVNVWAKMEAEVPGLDLQTFCTKYLQEHNDKAFSRAEAILPGVTAQGVLGMLLAKLYRYTNIYVKKALQDLPLSSIDEAIYLEIIARAHTPRKSDVIHEALSEFPSGIDIIKRLVKYGLVEELPDAEDRRSKRLRLTNAGEAMLLETRKRLARASQLAFGTLSQGEMAEMIPLLFRLEQHHANHYKAVRSASDIETVEQLFG